jgi:hypothetical protein
LLSKYLKDGFGANFIHYAKQSESAKQVNACQRVRTAFWFAGIAFAAPTT